MLVTDLRHLLDLPEDTPGPARRLAQYLGIVRGHLSSGRSSSPRRGTRLARLIDAVREIL